MFRDEGAATRLFAGVAIGFEGDEVEEVRAALPAAGEVRRKGNWALLVVSR